MQKLAAQVSGLKIVDRCRCGDDFCASFCTERKPQGAYGAGHRCVELEPETGWLILDVVADKIVLSKSFTVTTFEESFSCLFP